MTPVTVITWPLTPTVPVDAIVQPALPLVMDGADQFAGTVNSTAPLFMPPATDSVYVSVSVSPVEPATCDVGAIAAVPLPSAAFVTFTDGNGEYRFRFDLGLVDNCRTQYVRVSAQGYESRLLVLMVGQNVRSEDVLLKHK